MGAVWSSSLPCWAAAGDCGQASPGTRGRRSGPRFQATSTAFQSLAAGTPSSWLSPLSEGHCSGTLNGDVREVPTGMPVGLS